MWYYLPSSGAIDSGQSGEPGGNASSDHEIMNDLKVFWGPEICRLEYLVHLLDTGRIKNEFEQRSEST